MAVFLYPSSCIWGCCEGEKRCDYAALGGITRRNLGSEETLTYSLRGRLNKLGVSNKLKAESSELEVKKHICPFGVADSAVFFSKRGSSTDLLSKLDTCERDR